MLQLIIDQGFAITDEDLLPCFEIEQITSNIEITHILLGLVKDLNCYSSDIALDIILRPIIKARTTALVEDFLDRDAAKDEFYNLKAYASLHGRIDIVNALLNWDVNGVCIPRHILKGALLFAVNSGHFIVVRSIVAYGVDIDTLNYGLRHLTLRNGLRIAEFLLENGAEINAVALNERTPLNAPCRQANSDLVQFLLSRGADSNTVDGRLESPLESALYYPVIVKFLLEHGADPNQRFNRDGSTPMLVALQTDRGSGVHHVHPGISYILVEMLLRYGADPNLADIRTGLTALMVAAVFKHIDYAELLLKCGADVTQLDHAGKTVLDVLSDTPRHSAQHTAHYTAVAELCKQYIDINRPEAKPILK